jgi:hypothetical protein
VNPCHAGRIAAAGVRRLNDMMTNDVTMNDVTMNDVTMNDVMIEPAGVPV